MVINFGDIILSKIIYFVKFLRLNNVSLGGTPKSCRFFNFYINLNNV